MENRNGVMRTLAALIVLLTFFAATAVDTSAQRATAETTAEVDERSIRSSQEEATATVPAPEEEPVGSADDATATPVEEEPDTITAAEGDVTAQRVPMGAEVKVGFVAIQTGTYNPATGEGADLANATESLNGEGLYCGDLVIFFNVITVQDDPEITEPTTVTLTDAFDRVTTSGYPVGLTFVGAQLNVEGSGFITNGNETLQIEDVSVAPDEYQITTTVTGVDRGEQITVRYEFTIDCNADPANSTGSIQANQVSGETAEGDVVSTGNDTVNLNNPELIRPAQEPVVTVIKTDEAGGRLAGATFTATNQDGVSETLVTGDDGTVTFTAFALGDTVTIVETDAPAGFIEAEPQTIVIDELAEVVTFVNVAEAGSATVLVAKVICADTSRVGEVDYFLEPPTPRDLRGCIAAAAGAYTFQLLDADTGAALDVATTNADGVAILSVGVDPAGPGRNVTVVEVSEVANASPVLTLLAGDVRNLLAVNYIPAADEEEPVETGTVQIIKLYCSNDELAGTAEFEVLGPEAPFMASDGTDIAGQAGWQEPDNCVPGEAEFAIYPFGDVDAEPFIVSVDAGGVTILESSLITTDIAPHTIVELGSGAAFGAEFDVAVDEVTQIIVINYVSGGVEEEKKGGDTTGGTTTGDATGGTTTGGGAATTLPDTGAGMGQSGVEYGMALLLALGSLAAAGLSVRRRAA